MKTKALIFFVCTQLATGLGAKTFPPEWITREMLMDSQGELMTALGLSYGPDFDANLAFASSVNGPLRSYSFASLPGSTYQGLPFSFAGSGGFGSGGWSFNGAGTYAGTETEEKGRSITVPDEDAPDAGKSEWTVKIGDTEYVFEADVEYYDPYPELPNLFQMRSKGTFRLKGTDTEIHGTDVQNLDGSWTWTLTDVRGAGPNAFGISTIGGGIENGFFQARFHQMPDQSVGTSMLAALFCGVFAIHHGLAKSVTRLNAGRTLRAVQK
jgi:hypothetical protein